MKKSIALLIGIALILLGTLTRGIPTSKAGLERKLGKALLKVLFGK